MKPPVLTNDLVIYRKLQGDDQDSICLLTVEDLIAIGHQLSPVEADPANDDGQELESAVHGREPLQRGTPVLGPRTRSDFQGTICF